MDSFDIVVKVKTYTLDECRENDRRLIEYAKEATKAAYAPYSGFKVGAAVLLENGIITTGTNQENAAYPSGLCAERVALFHTNSQYPDIPVEAIAVVAHNENEFTNDICTPCGSCRQVLAEVESRYGKSIRILMCGKNQIYEVSSIKYLLPLSFGNDMLK